MRRAGHAGMRECPEWATKKECVKTMDEIAELNRIWENTESRLSALNGDQEREYNVVKDGVIVGKITLLTSDGDDEILDNLIEAGFIDNRDYFVSGSGEDDTFNIEFYLDEERKIEELTTLLTLTTNDEIEDFDEFMDNVLDIRREQYLSGRDGWITKEYTIVTGTGGPHVEFTTGYEIRVYWGGKSREFTTYDDGARATMDRIEEYLNEIYVGN